MEAVRAPYSQHVGSGQELPPNEWGLGRGKETSPWCCLPEIDLLHVGAVGPFQGVVAPD